MSIFDFLKLDKTDSDNLVGNDTCKCINDPFKKVNDFKWIDKVPKRYQAYEVMTIQDLVSSGQSFWKFTQSHPGLSHEEHYEKYNVNEIETAKTDDEWLSFVESKDIGKCIGYGDRLTELLFDLRDERISLLKDNPVINKDNAFGEYTTQQVIVKKHYSMADPETIKRILKMSSPESIRAFLFSPISNAKNTLEKYGFQESKKFVTYIMDNYNFAYTNNINEFKNNLDQIFKEWTAKEATVNPLETLEQNQISEINKFEEKEFLEKTKINYDFR